jgi:hypothetical protein
MMAIRMKKCDYWKSAAHVTYHNTSNIKGRKITEGNIHTRNGLTK